MGVVNFTPRVTICAKCCHFKCEGDIWYDQFCGHPHVQWSKMVDPVTGVAGYGGENDLGQAYITERSEPCARDINQGNCPHYGLR